ncbi:hypothetical protein CB1_001094001 [Camelus ferus]|nr:hypothetical protein CB1_001094001 [Camelus ferus]
MTGNEMDDKARKLDCGHNVVSFKWKAKYGPCTVMEQVVLRLKSVSAEWVYHVTPKIDGSRTEHDIQEHVYYPELSVWVSQEPFPNKEMEGRLPKASRGPLFDTGGLNQKGKTGSLLHVVRAGSDARGPGGVDAEADKAGIADATGSPGQSVTLDLKSKEEKDAELDKKIEAHRRKNETIWRYQEIEEDRKKAELEGVAVTAPRKGHSQVRCGLEQEQQGRRASLDDTGDTTPSMTGWERSEYLRWKQEREKNDQERLQRHRKPTGQWRQEWDAEKTDGMFKDGPATALEPSHHYNDQAWARPHKRPTFREFLSQHKAEPQTTYPKRLSPAGAPPRSVVSKSPPGPRSPSSFPRALPLLLALSRPPGVTSPCPTGVKRWS